MHHITRTNGMRLFRAVCPQMTHCSCCQCHTSRSYSISKRKKTFGSAPNHSTKKYSENDFRAMFDSPDEWNDSRRANQRDEQLQPVPEDVEVTPDAKAEYEAFFEGSGKSRGGRNVKSAPKSSREATPSVKEAPQSTTTTSSASRSSTPSTSQAAYFESFFDKGAPQPPPQMHQSSTSSTSNIAPDFDPSLFFDSPPSYDSNHPQYQLPENDDRPLIGKKKKMDPLTQQQIQQWKNQLHESISHLEQDKVYGDFESQLLKIEEEIWNEFRNSGKPFNAHTVRHVQQVIAETKENVTNFYSGMTREEMQELLQKMKQHEKQHPIRNTPLNQFFRKIAGRDIASHDMTEEEMNSFFEILTSKEKGKRFKRQLRKILPDSVIKSFGYNPEELKKQFGDDAPTEEETAQLDAEDPDNLDEEDELVADQGDENEDLTYEQIKARMDEMNQGYPQGAQIKTDPALDEYIDKYQLHEQVQQARAEKKPRSEHVENKKSGLSKKEAQKVQQYHDEDDAAYQEMMARSLFEMGESFSGSLNQMEDYQVDNWKHLMKKQFEEDPYMKELFEKEFGADSDAMIDNFAESMLKKKGGQ